MKFQLLAVDVLDSQGRLRELNAFLASHRVLGLSKELVQLGGRAYWTFCIEYGDVSSVAAPETGDAKPKVDYRDVLSVEEFDLYSQMRAFRKRLAEREGVQLYTVMTNAQLAEVVQRKITTRDELSTVKGIGEARVARFGDEVLDFMRKTCDGTTP